MIDYIIIQFITDNIGECPPFLLWIWPKCYCYVLDMNSFVAKKTEKEKGEMHVCLHIMSWLIPIWCLSRMRVLSCTISCTTDAVFKMTNWSLWSSTGIWGSHSQNRVNNRVPCRCFPEKKFWNILCFKNNRISFILVTLFNLLINLPNLIYN